MNKRKKAVIIGCLALFFLVGCASQSASDTGTSNAQSSNAGNDSVAGSSSEQVAYDEAKAKETYQQSCVGCHGQNLEGSVGPSLKTVGSKLDEKQILEVITKGRGQMPGGLVSEEDAKNLAAWLANHK